MTDKEQVKLLTAVAGTFVGAVVIQYANIMRVERKKRKQIKVWEQVNLACIENYKARLIEALNDDSVSVEEFKQIWREEGEFLRIVQKQPMY